MLNTSEVDWDGSDWLKDGKCWNEPLLNEEGAIVLFNVVYSNPII